MASWTCMLGKCSTTRLFFPVLFLLKKERIFVMCMGVCAPCECSTSGGQQRASDPLRLLQVNCHVVAGTKPRSSVKAACALNH